jgi:hypothetical protein
MWNFARAAQAAGMAAALTVTVIGCGNHAGLDASTPPDEAASDVADVVNVTPPLEELPSVTLPDGVSVHLELAETPEEISQGLMFRPSLADDRGMLFLFDRERIPSFWMKNTLIALDIVFLDTQGSVVDVTRDAQPCEGEPCPQYVPSGPCTAVLEVKAGTAAAHGIERGTQLVFQRVPGYPKGRD